MVSTARLAILFLFMIACGKPAEEGWDFDEYEHDSGQKELGEFYGADGRCLHYIGHRLCGDYAGIMDNTIDGALICKRYEVHPCFKHYEFDVNSAKDCVLVRHDYFWFQKGKHWRPVLKMKCNDFAEMDLAELVERMIEEVRPQAPVRIDVKVLARKDWDDLVAGAEKLREAGIRVSFQARADRKGRYRDLEDRLAALGYRFHWNY
jgi:hypothetical protein